MPICYVVDDEMRDESSERDELRFQEYWNRYGRLVMRVLKRYAPAVDEDLLQVGRIALWEAMTTYDGSRGMKFSSWLWRLTMMRVLEWRAVSAYPVVLPYYLVSSGRIPSITSVSVSHSGYSDDEGEVDQIGIEEVGYARACECVDNRIVAGRLRSLLTPRQWYCVCRYFGLLDGEPASMESIASELGVSRQAVHLNLRAAMERIRRDSWFVSQYGGTV